MKELLATRKLMAEFLRSTREEAGISLDEAARHLQLEVPFILNVEAGLEDVNLTDIFAFANLYDVAPSRVMQLLMSVSDSRTFSSLIQKDEEPVRGAYLH